MNINTGMVYKLILIMLVAGAIFLLFMQTFQKTNLMTEVGSETATNNSDSVLDLSNISPTTSNEEFVELLKNIEQNIEEENIRINNSNTQPTQTKPHTEFITFEYNDNCPQEMLDAVDVSLGHSRVTYKYSNTAETGYILTSIYRNPTCIQVDNSDGFLY